MKREILSVGAYKVIKRDNAGSYYKHCETHPSAVSWALMVGLKDWPSYDRQFYWSSVSPTMAVRVDCFNYVDHSVAQDLNMSARFRWKVDSNYIQVTATFVAEATREAGHYMLCNDRWDKYGWDEYIW